MKLDSPTVNKIMEVLVSKCNPDKRDVITPDD